MKVYSVCILSIFFICSCQSSRSKLDGKTQESQYVGVKAYHFEPHNPPRIVVANSQNSKFVEDGAQVTFENFPLNEEFKHKAEVFLGAQHIQTIQGEGPHFIKAPELWSPGVELLRIFLKKANGEWIKAPDSFYQGLFHTSGLTEVSINKKTQIPRQWVLINHPRGIVSGQNILFDFYIYGLSLPSKNHRLIYSINGLKRELKDWQPFSFQNLEPGTYNLEIYLADKSGRKLSHSWASDKSQFVVSE